MKIAWRYSTVPQVESSVGRGKASARFDLSKKVAVESDEKLHMFQDDPSYSSLWQHLHKLLTSERFSIQGGNPKEKNLLRICISDFGSPLWSDVECLKRFTLHLRAFTRQAHCVTMLVTDSSTLTDAEYRSLVAQVDAAFRLDVVSESEQEALPSQDRFHGRFHILKLPTITSVAPPRPECVDLVYVLHRRYLDIKVLHLPPAIGNDEAVKTSCQRVQDEF
ncbi:paxneb protein [Aphelenchoides avenae]|nr:paxneb protein [Aphelenchus avenae]